MADAEQVQSAINRVAGELGPPTVLVNTAGIIRDNLLHKMTDDDWDTRHQRVPARRIPMSRAAQAHMTEQRWGPDREPVQRLGAGNRGQANYAAAKARLQG